MAILDCPMNLCGNIRCSRSASAMLLPADCCLPWNIFQNRSLVLPSAARGRRYYDDELPHTLVNSTCIHKIESHSLKSSSHMLVFIGWNYAGSWHEEDVASGLFDTARLESAPCAKYGAPSLKNLTSAASIRAFQCMKARASLVEGYCLKHRPLSVPFH